MSATRSWVMLMPGDITTVTRYAPQVGSIAERGVFICVGDAPPSKPADAHTPRDSDAVLRLV